MKDAPTWLPELGLSNELRMLGERRVAAEAAAARVAKEAAAEKRLRAISDAKDAATRKEAEKMERAKARLPSPLRCASEPC